MTRFIENSDNTVTDTQTGLIWAKRTLPTPLKHEEAVQAVANIGDGWRLPTVEELFTLIQFENHLPAIDTNIFKDTENDKYWTSTPFGWNEDSAFWAIDFDFGRVRFQIASIKCYVRAVRSTA